MKQHVICALLLSLTLTQSCTNSEEFDLENHPLKSFFNVYGFPWLEELGFAFISENCSGLLDETVNKACDDLIEKAIQKTKDELGLTVKLEQIKQADFYDEVFQLSLLYYIKHKREDDFREKVNRVWLDAGGKIDKD